MKHLATLLIALLITTSGLAQSYKTEITKEAETYYKHMENKNFDGVFDYMYPKVFDFAPRDQMKMAMDQMFNSKEMKIEFISNEVQSVSDKKEVDDITYAAVFYNSKMKMTFVSEQDKPEDDKASFLGFMKGTMESQFGEGNVTSDVKDMSLVINMDANMFAINDPKYDGWKFIGNDDSMTQITNSIVPEAVRTELLKEK
ncbi:hypothetical protein [uncultured Psychroserpens sp.]|uniref:hypothetical protein n=1 Tax=uncultured Psychroserpens sp. TaxID=255436 RepID=UPI0026347E27|nr:hypothetical protein [uncultured Psychroserpens sp.]